MARQRGVKLKKQLQNYRVKMDKRTREKRLHQRWYCYPTIAEAIEKNRSVHQERTRIAIPVPMSKYDLYWNNPYPFSF